MDDGVHEKGEAGECSVEQTPAARKSAKNDKRW